MRTPIANQGNGIGPTVMSRVAGTRTKSVGQAEDDHRDAEQDRQRQPELGPQQRGQVDLAESGLLVELLRSAGGARRGDGRRAAGR